jgi:hypothetical protein
VSAVKQDTDNGVRHAIEVRGLDNRFGTQQVHQDLTWTCGAGNPWRGGRVRHREIRALA